MVLSARADVAEMKRMGLLICVDSHARDLPRRERHVRPMQMGGRTMNGVRAAPQGYRTDAALKMWVMRAVAFLAARPERAKRGQAGQGAARAPQHADLPRAIVLRIVGYCRGMRAPDAAR
jgi:hypothetical protein